MLPIYCGNNDLGQWVNKVGKYLREHIDGAYKIKFSPMTCDVTMRMYYQIPGQGDSLSEMQFDINITSYQNKLRINITEITVLEKTIGQIIFQPDELNDLQLVKKKVLARLKKAIEKEYSEYDFIY